MSVTPTEVTFGVLPKTTTVFVGAHQLTLREPTMIVVKQLLSYLRDRVKGLTMEGTSWAWFLGENIGTLSGLVLDTADNRADVGVADSLEFARFVEENLTVSQCVAFVAAFSDVFDLGTFASQLRAPLEKISAQMTGIVEPVAAPIPPTT